MLAWVKSDTEIIEDLIEGVGGAIIVNEHNFGRMDTDEKEALREVMDEYYELKEESEVIAEMEKHIEKLEGMLDRRNARYKKWEDV